MVENLKHTVLFLKGIDSIQMLATPRPKMLPEAVNDEDSDQRFNGIESLGMIAVAAVSGANQHKNDQLRLEIRLRTRLGFFLLVHERRGVWARKVSRPGR